MILFQKVPDFKKYYKMMKLVSPYLKSLIIPVNVKKQFKTGFNWINSLFSTLTKLEAFTLTTIEKGSISNDVIK